MPKFERDKPGERLDFGGMCLVFPPDRLPPNKTPFAQNIRRYLKGGIIGRNLLTIQFVAFSSAPQTIKRLNDTTPAGPELGYVIIVAAGNSLYSNGIFLGNGLSGNQVSIAVFRPNTSVQPWAYVGDISRLVTINTKFLLNNAASVFQTVGMLKVRSDGLIYKMGIQEPSSAPTVSTATTVTTGSGPMAATAVPWNNVGGANSTYNYGQTNASDGSGPFIISLLPGSQELTLIITGSATVNGASHAPGDIGPSGTSFPGHFLTFAEVPFIVLGAFTDGSGNVLTGISPIALVVNVGGVISFPVPASASQFQIGVDSSANTFSSNSGAFTVNWTLSVSSVATQISTLGQVTAYVFGDSPHSGPVGDYIWKNPNDGGSGIDRSISTASVSPTNNSWNMQSPTNNTTPVNWDTLASDGSISGTVPLFTPALETEGYQDFNVCVVGTIFVPTAGTYPFSLTYKDQVMFGIGGGATLSVSSGPGNVGTARGQRITVVNALPILFTGGGTAGDDTSPALTTDFNITFPGTGSYQVEFDWDYWDKDQATLIFEQNNANIPPIEAGTRTDVVYYGVYRSSATGATSNPSPASTPEVTPVLDNTVSIPWSPDPQVDKVDFYRQDSGLANPTYVATGPNTNPPTPILDSLSDLDAATNQVLSFDNFEPFPSIDLPAAGVLNVSGGVITWVSGNQFNVRWLPGTVIEIGSPTQLAYTLVSRPTSTTTMTIPDVPDGTNLIYNIPEPILAQQCLPYFAGPTDNINFIFAVGDPLRPGTLYWCEGSNFDSAPDTNQLDVTDPGEALVNVCISGGFGVLFSIKRAWLIAPNFFNALATVTGTDGSAWSLQESHVERGLYIPRCLCVSGGGLIFFRVSDGIHVSEGGLASQSITDEDLYPLFSHENDDIGNSVPQPVTIAGYTVYPPNDALPQNQNFSIIGAYLYYNYLDATSTPRTLVYDIAAKGWVVDVYETPAIIHAPNEGESTQGVLVGCSDGGIRQLSSEGIEVATAVFLTPCFDAGDTRSTKKWSDLYIESTNP